MEKEYNPSETDTSEQGVSSEEGGEDVSDGDILGTINEATGRDYKSQEDAIKGIKETASYVGKVGKYQKAIKTLEELKGGEKGAIEFLASLKDEKKDDAEQPNEVDTLKKDLEEVKRENFFNANQELKPFKDTILKLKKDGQSFEDVIKENKNLVDTLKASVENQGQKSVIHSDAGVSQTSSDYQEDFKKAKETGNWAEFITKHKGVKV